MISHCITVPGAWLAGLLILLVAVPASAVAEGPQDAKTDYMPEIHGALRARYELGLEDEGSRFQVRNARVTLNGNLAPIIDYFIQTDLCDRGKMKILDAWGRIELARGLRLQAGQFRLPFGTDCFRAPANYVFANRSYIGKNLCNVRGVGGKLSYSLRLSGSRSLSVEGGLFNTTSISDHDVWCKEMSYSVKAVYAMGEVKLSSGLQSIEPDSVRINLWNASVTWTPGRWTIEGEYMSKHYTNDSHRTAHGWLMWADYALPVKAGVFNRASFQARWDGMTAHSNGSRGDDGRLATTNPARQRITAGATLTYAYKSVRCDLRLDYEKCFYHSGTYAVSGEGDKICAEMVIRF